MASIQKKDGRIYVVYRYVDEEGRARQKWEGFRTMKEAQQRKVQVEYQLQADTFRPPEVTTMNSLLDEYINMYGTNRWALSTYTNNVRLIDLYIRPVLGELEVKEITARTLDNYYRSLPEIGRKLAGKKKDRPGRSGGITEGTAVRIHRLLRSCFNQAVRWDIMDKNPAYHVIPPKHAYKKREIWDADTLLRASKLCRDPGLKLAMNLAFSCTLRMGELLALTWKNVDISNESIADGKASIHICQELQRVSRKSLSELHGKDVKFIFPQDEARHHTTALVIKSPKTDSSIRTVFLPGTVAEMLAEQKARQEKYQRILGKEYNDYDLVMAYDDGRPIEGSAINARLHKLIEENGLPPVVFHSFRHSSITYKLMLNGGDIKSVQGDSGHAQSRMVTEVYSHILDSERKKNAMNFEEAFYSGRDQGKQPQGTPAKDAGGRDTNEGLELMRKIAENPELMEMLKLLIKNMN